MPYMTRVYLIFPWVILILLPGCAALSPLEPVTTTVQSVPTTETAPGPELPAVALTGSILFQLLAADVAAQRQQPALAAQLYLQVAQETRDPRVAERATRMALFSRSDQAALEAAQLWLALVPDSRAGHEAIIAAYIRNGDEQGVQEHFDYLLAHGPDDSERVFSLVISLLQREQDTQLAYKVLRQLAARHTDNAKAQFAFSYIAMRARQLDAARSAVERTLVLQPDWLKAMNLYARVIQMQGNHYEATIYLGGVVKRFPEVASMRLKYAQSLVETRQLHEALEQYLLLIEQEAYDEKLLFVAGLLSLQLNDQDQAHDLLQRLVSMGQRLEGAHFYLGQLADMRGQADVAIDHYAEVTKGEHFMNAQMSMILLLARRGDQLLAQQQLEKVRSQMPGKLSRIDAMAGQVLEESGQLEESLAVYSAALLRDPDEQRLLYGQALVAERLGLYEQSEKSLLHILALAPDNIGALNALGFALADRTTRYQEAYGYIQRAIDLRPHSAAIVDSMGWVLYRLGRLDEALEYLRRSLEINQDQEVAAHLGEVLWMRGEHSAARSIWRQALDWVPDDQLILDVMKRFGQ